MTLNERRPNWAKWKHVPYLKPYQAVALSLDIDPDKVKINENSWMAEKLIFNESQDFIDREFIVRSNLGEALESTFKGISLSEFARWAISIGWEAPPEFQALTDSASRAPGSSAAPADLEGKSRATALKLILGMALAGYRYDPKANKSGTVKEICDDLQRYGISLTDDTVRQWLKEASVAVDWDMPH